VAWLDNLYKEIKQENEGIPLHKTKSFLEMLTIAVLAVRAFAECLEIFTDSISAPLSAWGISFIHRVAPYLQWMPGLAEVTPTMYAAWIYSLLMHLIIYGVCTFISVLLLRAMGKKVDWNFLVILIFVAFIPGCNWWFTSSGEAIWVILPQKLYISFDWAKQAVCFPIEKVESFFETYIFFGLIFLIWSIILTFGLIKRFYQLTWLQALLVSLPWLLFYFYIMSGPLYPGQYNAINYKLHVGNKLNVGGAVIQGMGHFREDFCFRCHFHELKEGKVLLYKEQECNECHIKKEVKRKNH